MELFSSVWHLISALLIFFAGAFIVNIISSGLKISSIRSLTIYCWHTAMCMVYLWYVINNGGDALSYYKKTQITGLEFSPGTEAVSYLTTLIVKGFGTSLLGAFLFYNIIGSVGLLFFHACLRTATYDKSESVKKLATLIVFLPSVSFWSSAIGKDAISFTAASLSLWAALNIKRRAGLMIIAVAMMFFVRPHIAGILIISLTLAALFINRTNIFLKILLGGIAAGAAALLVPFALHYAGVGETIDNDTLMAYVEKRQSYNMEGGGGVDIASMTLPMQLFTYLFRPVIFEARSIFSFAAAIDNLILLYLFIVGGRGLLGRVRSGLGESRVFMWAYALLAWLVLAMTTANLGIALRQKWMFVPMLIFLFISVIGRRQHQHRPLQTPLAIREPSLGLSKQRLL
ncbi:MAG: hypothetical protein V4624_02425 [Pseudomonadota bacterium]